MKEISSVITRQLLDLAVLSRGEILELDLRQLEARMPDWDMVEVRLMKWDDDGPVREG